MTIPFKTPIPYLKEGQSFQDGMTVHAKEKWGIWITSTRSSRRKGSRGNRTISMDVVPTCGL